MKLRLEKCERVSVGHLNSTIASNIVSNFSSYILTQKETALLSLSLDHYLQFTEKGKRVQVEFERFYQSIFSHTTHLNGIDKIGLKNAFYTAFEKYEKIKLRQGKECSYYR